MMLTFPADFYKWAQQHPQVWWHTSARWAMGKVAPGEPGIETDDEGEPTGNLVMHHPDIDVWDQAIMDVCVAGWQYALTLDDDGPAVAAIQAQKDEAALRTLLANVQAEKMTLEQAYDRIKAEVRRQAGVLGVDISYVDAKPEEEEQALEQPNKSDLKAEWEEYATSLGIDVDGLTKDEIIEKVDGLKAD